MNKLKYLIVVMFLFIGIKNIYAISNFDNTVKVYDYAQILSDKEEIELKTKINNYINTNNLDMAIVTVKYYQQTTVDQYLTLFYNHNNFGKGTTKDGIIIAIDLKDTNENIGIKTFGKATNLYNEEEIQKIYTEINKEKNYYDKLNSFIDYSNLYVNEENIIVDSNNNIFRSINWLFISSVSLIISVLIIILCLIKNKKIKEENIVNCYIKEGSIVINKKEDKFITTNTKKSRVSKRGKLITK